MTRENVRRKRAEGSVISNKMEKTVVVRVDETITHPRYGKKLNRWKKYYAHTDTPLEMGAKVKIMETRPLSKLKRWIVVHEENSAE